MLLWEDPIFGLSETGDTLSTFGERGEECVGLPENGFKMFTVRRVLRGERGDFNFLKLSLIL